MRKIIPSLMMLFIIAVSENCLYAQEISTIAGTGVSGYSGDGLQGTHTMISSAARIAYDPNTNNIYIADVADNLILMLNSSGIVTTVAGNGSVGFSGDNGLATEASLCKPASTLIDSNGNLYIADAGNRRVRKVSASGIITTYAGDGSIGYTGDGGQATNASLTQPSGLAIDKSGNLYIADQGANVVRMVTPNGIITTVVGTGTGGYNADNIPATAAELNAPSGLAIDTAGNIYIADNGNNRIRIILIGTGNIATFAGTGSATNSGDGSFRNSAGIPSPSGLGIDDSGNVFITEPASSIVRKINLAGIINTIAGNDTAGYNGDNIAATSAELNSPMDVKADKNGNLIITDNNNYRVRYVCNHPDSLSIAITVTPYDTILQGTPVLFTCTATGGGYNLTYQWKKNGSDVGTNTNTYSDDTYATGDQVYCVVTSNSSCTLNPNFVTDTTTMDVIGEAGINNIAGNENIVVYPNPFSDQITVKGLGAGDRLCLYDLMGRRVTTEQTVDGSTTETSFTVPNLAAGTYILQVVNGSGYKKINLPVVKQ